MSSQDVIEIIGYLMTSFATGFGAGFLMKTFFKSSSLVK